MSQITPGHENICEEKDYCVGGIGEIEICTGCGAGVGAGTGTTGAGCVTLAVTFSTHESALPAIFHAVFATVHAVFTA